MGSHEVRRAAARVQQLGDDVRRLADQALGAGAVHWRSTAAAGFRERLAEEAGRVRFAANRLDAAAEALRRHAACLETSVEELRGWLRLGGGR
jgi:hypothetical protein